MNEHQAVGVETTFENLSAEMEECGAPGWAHRVRELGARFGGSFMEKMTARDMKRYLRAVEENAKLKSDLEASLAELGTIRENSNDLIDRHFKLVVENAKLKAGLEASLAAQLLQTEETMRIIAERDAALAVVAEWLGAGAYHSIQNARRKARALVEKAKEAPPSDA